jgi:hypothetical protein
VVEALCPGHLCFGARERQVNVWVLPTGNAIEESVDLADEIFNRVFRRVPERMPDNQQL